MNKMFTVGLAALLTMSCPGVSLAGHETPAQARHTHPKPLTDNVHKGLAYLISQQLPTGGWSEGEESTYMRGSGYKNAQNVANLADTCMAALAILRCGNYPDSKSPYAANVGRAVAFVCASIEKADRDSLFVTDVRGTRVQAKLGPYVDTFLAAQFLSEVKAHMPDRASNDRVVAALNKVIGKIETNQRGDGVWVSSGWAPVHSQALATRALNRAKQVGMTVSDEVLERAERHARGRFDDSKGTFVAEGSAGVPLYAAGATLGALQESINTNKQEEQALRALVARPGAPAEAREKAMSKLKRFDEVARVQDKALAAVTGRFADDRFVQGFGCNGGEEFLSYLQISETLLANASNKFADWDRRITANLNHVQGNDGSWMGQHCITSRTFCTAAALLVLAADRAPHTVATNRGQRPPS